MNPGWLRGSEPSTFVSRSPPSSDWFDSRGTDIQLTQRALQYALDDVMYSKIKIMKLAGRTLLAHPEHPQEVSLSLT